MSAFGDTRALPVSDDTFVYFLTDDVPNPEEAGIDNDGSGADVSIAEWESFLSQLPPTTSPKRSPSAWDHHPGGIPSPGEPPPGLIDAVLALNPVTGSRGPKAARSCR